MAESRQQEIMRRRAFALTEVLLSGREGVRYQVESSDTGIDYLVRLQGRTGLRQLGVELRYVWAKQTATAANLAVRPALREHRRRYSPFPFPVVLFFFTMEDNGSWYTWVAEPGVSGGKPVLATPEPDCRPLDGQALQHIIVQTDRWYDAYFSSIVAVEPVVAT